MQYTTFNKCNSSYHTLTWHKDSSSEVFFSSTLMTVLVRSLAEMNRRLLQIIDGLLNQPYGPSEYTIYNVGLLDSQNIVYSFDEMKVDYWW